MIEKIKQAVDKITTLINNNKRAFTVTATALLAVVAVTILVCTMAFNNVDNGEPENGAQWSSGITQNIPAFSDNAEKIEHNEKSTAAYYSNVKSEDVAKYIERLGEECGVKFEGRQYPKTATFEDKIIAIHYNVTEMRFSVTVAQKD